jgi:hypothetical protein
MACQIQTDKYTSVVLNLIKLNPSVYNNFDNSAEFIFKSSLTPEQKMMSLHNIAYIYAGLSGIDPSYYNQGKANDVITAFATQDNPSDYLTAVGELLGLKKPTALKIESISKAIEKLLEKANIMRQDLTSPDGVLTLVRNYMGVTQFPSNKEREALLDNISNSIKEAIDKHDSSGTHKDFLKKQVDAAITSLRKSSSFIPLSEISDIADLNNVLVTLTNGQMVEAIRKDEQFMLISEDNTLVPIDPSTVLVAKDARISDTSKSNAGQQVFTEDSIMSSFSVKAVNSADQFAIENKLAKMTNPQAGIKIHAVKISNVGDRRVKRINDTAKNNPKFADLANRSHETFENSAQIELLKSKPTAKVLTVSRPKASEQSFVLVGEIIGTGEKFYIYSTDNFVFVNADNTTERVDFANENHLALVKALSEKRTKEGNKELTDNDVQMLGNANVLYQSFKGSVQSKLDEEFSTGSTSTDVTTEFFNMYEAGSKRSNIERQIFSDELETDTTLSRPLTVVKVVNGEVVSSEIKNVPFVYVKVGLDQYQLRTFLAKGELIQLENGNNVTQEVYAESVLGIKSETIKGDIIKPEHKNQNAITIRFNTDGSYGYRAIEPLLQMSSQVEFAKFVTSLANIIQNSTNKTTDIRNFDRFSYAFKFYNKSTGDKKAPLRVNFATSKTGQLQIEIRPMDGNGPYGFISSPQNKNQFNFPVNEAIITKLAKSLIGQGALVNKVKEAYPILNTLDLTKPAELESFYNQVNQLAKSETALPVLKELQTSIENSQKEFAEYLVENVVNKLEERTTQFPEFLELLKKDFTFNGVYRPEFLVADTDASGVLYPRIVINKNSESHKSFYGNMSNYRMLSASAKSFTIVPRSSTPVLSEVLAPIVESEKIHVQEPIAASEDIDDDIPEIGMLSLVQGADIETETSEERISAAEWLAQNLPQFEIDSDSLSEVVDLTKLDGTVLGAFKNKVIYLNDALKGKGVIYHEAFHGVFRHLMSASERQTLVDAVVKNKKNSALFTESALKEFARQRNYVYNKQQMTNLQAEEILADGFQKYMIGSSKPKGIIAQFMAMLKKLLAMFVKNSNYIDTVYGNIKSGRYRSQVATSGMFDNQVAFELIPGLKEVVQTDAGVGQRQSTLTDFQQSQLIDMMTGYILEDGIKESFSDKFDRAADLLLKYEYNMDVLLRTNADILKSNPELKEKVLKTMGPIYANYRFMLGARVKGEALYDINNTDNPAYDKKFIKTNVVKDEDNHLGKVSYEILKKLVKAKVDSVNSILDGSEKGIDENVINDELSGANENIIANEDAENEQEVTESSDFESSFNEINALDSLPRQIRKFLAIVRHDQLDPTLGIKVPRMVPAEQLFGSLIKISAEIDPKNIVNHLKTVAETMIEDGHIVEGNDILQVHKKIAEYTKADANGVPQSNKQLYNMIVDVLHKTEIDYAMIDVKTKQTFLDSDEILTETTNFTLVDKVHSQDVNNKKRKVLTSIIKAYKENKNNPEYIAAVQKLISEAKKIKNSTFILSDVTSQNAKLENVTTELYNAFEAVGMKMPKSLIRMSIIAIDTIENKNTLNITGSPVNHYKAHDKFISEKKYLEKEFFTDVISIFEKITLNNISTNDFAVLLDERNDKNSNVNRFNSILKKSLEYVVKYDPTELPSTVRNAEGKPIYRYVSYTPATILAQSIRTKGLKATLEEDPFYKDFLETFYADNAMLSDLLAGNDTQKAKEMKLFMDNFKVALFGGVSQTIGQKQKQGKSFKNIDEKSLYITNLLMFLKRSTQSSFSQELDDAGNVKDITTKIQTYMRSYSQLEASQTNFLISALYQQYADKNGLVLNADKRLKIVDDLESVVKQEYNRIRKEWSKRIDNKDAFDAAESNGIVLKYNGVLDPADKSKAVTDKSSLRAYQFNKLPDFFTSNPDLATNANSTGLIDFAKQNKEFSELPEDVRDLLLDSLEDYAKEQLNKHATKLIDLNVLNKVTEKQRNAKGEAVTQGLKGPEVAPIVYYTSTLLPSILKVDDLSSVSIDGLYQKTKENYNEIGEKTEGKTDLRGLVADAFFNNWANSLHINEVLDGDIALNVKDPVDYFKRNKKFLAGGSTMKEGTHKVAFINTVEGYINERFPQYGPYYSLNEIEQDTNITDEQKEIFKSEFNSGVNMREIFDGQSISSLMHQIDMHESMGRLSPEILHSLIAKHYRRLSETEIRVMEAGKVVNNPKKTVTAARNSYHKQSENYIDRNDVSIFNTKAGESVEDAQTKIHGLYMEIYSLRKERQEMILNGDEGSTEQLTKQIKTAVQEIHSYYTAMPHRKVLHDILNSMEYHEIDQLMDTTASKNATKLPVDYFADRKNSADAYVNLELSSLSVDNKYKFLQVETSGVKDKAKFSVQSKALIAADLINLAKIAEISGKEISASEQKAIENIAVVLENYQSTLKEIGESNLSNLRTILRKDGDFEIGKIFNIIRTSLEEQGAPTATLKLFDVDPSGKPVHSPNLPGIRNMLEYYFFAQYSKNVTDEKGSGFKNIHISSFGYNVLEDTNGNVVTTEQYSRNPDKYPGVKSRPLGVSVEEVNGVKTYFIETIMPKPLFKSKAHEKFYMDNLIKMFGVRIPTEDKRSMIAIKVVDFIDSSNLNGVIVPHFVHLLAGSDFDVDALYGQTVAHYFDVSGNPIVYGDYKNQSKFGEFVHYMMKDPDLKAMIKKESEKLLSENAYEITDEALSILYTSGFDQSDYEGVMNFAAIRDEYQQIKMDIEELEEIRDEAREEFVDAIRKTEVDPSDRTARQDRRDLGREVFEYNEELGEKRDQRNEYGRQVSRAKRFTYAGLKVSAALKVFEQVGLPTNKTTFQANENYAKSVRPVYQNKNLQAKLDIISNEAVFNFLYINERSSTERFEDILRAFGINIEDFSTKYNHYTTDGVISTKVGNAMNKDGIGITANINKFLALASQYGLELKPESVVWAFKNASREQVKFDKFGSINAEDQRVIGIIGNILGMFADGAKKPIPAALYMNEVNAGVTLAMIGVGLSPEFAVGFNFIPEIRKAVQNVQATKYAVSESTGTAYKFLNNEVGDQIKNLLDENKDALKNLIASGLVSPASSPFKIIINKEKLLLDFKAKTLSQTALTSNTVNVNDIGYTVSAIVEGKSEQNEVERLSNTISLSEVEQRVILLQLYKEQAAQTFAIKRAGSLIDLFKKLNPSFVNFDKLLNNIKELKEDIDGKSIFTEESSSKIFESNQVWPSLLEAIEDLNEQSSKIFLERTEFFRPIKNSFETVFTDQANIAKIITSFIALRKYQLTMPGSRLTGTMLDSQIQEDDKNLLDTFTPEFWFTNTLPEELESMQKKYPENKFLQLLRPDVSENKVFLKNGGYLNERSLKMINKAKTSTLLSDQIANDADYLMRTENMFMKKLLYHELAKTGMQYKAGSFLQYLNPDMQLPLSGYIEDFVSRLEETKGDRYKLISAIKDFMGDQFTENDVYGLFDELFIQMAHAASMEIGNTKIKQVSSLSLNEKSNIMTSIAFSEESNAKERRAIAREVISRVIGQYTTNDALAIRIADTIDKKPVESLNINLDVPKDIAGVSDRTINSIASKLQIRYNGLTGMYSFPLIISVGQSKYLLQGIDDQIQNASFGKSVINSIVGKGQYINEGMSAKYALIPAQLTTGTLSPVGFTKEASQKYMAYVSGKEKIDYIAPKTEKPVQKSAPVAQSETSKVIEGDIFAGNGIPVITTNLGGVHGAGLAQAAKAKGLIKQGDGAFKATDKVVQLPVKKVWSDNMVMNDNMELLKESLRSLIKVARDNKENTYLLPLAGLGHGEGNIETILPLLIQTVKAAPNIKMVIPGDGVSLGRQGTVRRDYTRENLPMIKQMLSEAGLMGGTTKSQLQIDMDALNLTDEVVTALYNEGSKRMSIDAFKAQALGMIANLRATMSNNEIIEKIKCL